MSLTPQPLAGTMPSAPSPCDTVPLGHLTHRVTPAVSAMNEKPVTSSDVALSPERAFDLIRQTSTNVSLPLFPGFCMTPTNSPPHPSSPTKVQTDDLPLPGDAKILRTVSIRNPKPPRPPKSTTNQRTLVKKAVETRSRRQLELLDQINSMSASDFALVTAETFNKLTTEQFGRIKKELFSHIHEYTITCLHKGKAEIACRWADPLVLDRFRKQQKRKQKSKLPMKAPVTAVSMRVATRPEPAYVPETPVILPAPTVPCHVPELPQRPLRPVSSGENDCRRSKRGVKPTVNNWDMIVMSNVCHFRKRWAGEIGDDLFRILIILGEHVAEVLRGYRTEGSAEEVRQCFHNFGNFRHPFEARDGERVAPPVDTEGNWTGFVRENVFRFREQWGSKGGRWLIDTMVHVTIIVRDLIRLARRGQRLPPFDLVKCLSPSIN